MDRAIALLWLAGREDPSTGLGAKNIAEILRSAGHPQQNVSRLERMLRADKRTAAAPGGGWFLRPTARKKLDADYSSYVGTPELPESSSVVPLGLVQGTRSYIERIADQINKSFDCKLYDCCAVMCRRLLETLIIEMYEHQGREVEIKKDSHYQPLGDLVAYVESDHKISLSRMGLKALKDFKRLGDLSAHNRRYNARESDIAPLRDGIRLAVEEMLSIAGLYSKAPNSVAA
jgi:hypothetical protein